MKSLTTTTESREKGGEYEGLYTLMEQNPQIGEQTREKLRGLQEEPATATCWYCRELGEQGYS